VRGNEGARVVLSPIATPLPLTFIGLLLASALISGLELGWIPKAESQQTGWVLIAVPIPLQLIAAVFGFLGRSATAATGASTLAAVWLGIALDMINAPPGGQIPDGPVALISIAAGTALLVPALADGIGGSLLPAATLSLAGVRFVLTGAAARARDITWVHVSGIVGIGVAALALYTAIALEIEEATQAKLFPTFRRGQAAAALTASLDVQFETLEHEAGVRRNL